MATFNRNGLILLIALSVSFHRWNFNGFAVALRSTNLRKLGIKPNQFEYLHSTAITHTISSRMKVLEGSANPQSTTIDFSLPIIDRSDPISELMKISPYVTVYSTDSVFETIKRMNKAGRGGALVLDPITSKLAGVFTGNLTA